MTRKRRTKSRPQRANGAVAETTAKKDHEPGDEEPQLANEMAVIVGPETGEDIALETDDTGTFAALEVAAEDRPEGGVALTSLQRLENDIQELHSRWAAVEGELVSRDAEIARLEEDRSIQLAAFKAQQAELDEAKIREEEQQAEIDLRSGRLEALLAAAAQDADELAARDKQLANGESTLADLQAELDAARHAEQAIQDQLKAQREEYSASVAQVDGLKATIAELKINITDLESYIDRRKAEWIQQTADLERYRDALSGMEGALQKKAEQVGRVNNDNMELSAEIVKLQNQCSEMDGRRAERELANEELQDRLAERASEIEVLRQELLAAEQASVPLSNKVEEFSVQLDAARTDSARLQSDLQELRRDTERAKTETRANADSEISAMRSTLESALKDANELQLRLADSEGQITGLQAELEGEHVKFQQIRDAAESAEDRLAGAVEERDTLRSERDQLRTLLEQLESEFSEFRNTTTIDLEAGMQRSVELEQELDASKAALRSLDRNVAMVNKINASVQRLDEQISASSSPSSEDDGKPGARRLMVAFLGQKKVRYPLYKDSMTIGRSPDADIQVRQKWISRQHARIVMDDNMVMIEDLGSKNGILINNRAVHAGELHDQDVVEIGDTQFQFIDLMQKPGEHVA